VTTVPTTAPTAKYVAGDIVGKTASPADQFVILSYDPASDTYTRAWIYQNTDGSWGHRLDSSSDTLDRATLEKVYPVKIAHIDVTTIPIQTLTVVTTATTVSTNAPVISNVTPNSGASGGSVTVTISGNNFESGATVEILRGGSASITATGVSVSSSSITATFNLNGANNGVYNVEVIDPDNQFALMPSAFTVGVAAPTISSVSPSTLALNQTGSLTINGQNFVSPALVTFTQGSVTIGSPYVSGIQVVSPTQITASFTVPSTMATGSWTVTVTNIAAQESGTWTGFTITNTTS
jgi:hypothetical protein